MKYVVDIPPELAEDINRQIKSGKYRSPQDFMLAAIQNQAYLETVEVDSTVTVSGNEHSGASSAQPSPIASKAPGAKLLLLPNSSQVKTVPVGNMYRSDYP